MLRLFIRFILAILTLRVLGALFGAPRPPLKPASRPDPKPIVDRSTAIDVPFTEEHPET